MHKIFSYILIFIPTNNVQKLLFLKKISKPNHVHFKKYQINSDFSTKADLSLLQANSKTAQISYSNGKYGITIDGTFYELGGGSGSPKLNFTTPYFTFSSSALSKTVERDCYLYGAINIAGSYVTVTLTVGNVASVFECNNGAGGPRATVRIEPLFIPKGTTVSLSGSNSTISLFLLDEL